MAFNVEEFIIDRVMRVHMFDYDGKRRWTASHITDATLECGGETVYSTDELGTNIMAFDRSKSATFSCTSKMLDIPVLADQLGAKVEKATSSAKVDMHCFEFLEVKMDSGKPVATLTHDPKAETEGVYFKYVDQVNSDNSTVKTFELGATATTNFTVSGKTITLPTSAGLKAGDRVAVKYIYEATEGQAFDNDYTAFSEYGEALMEVLAYSPCNRAEKCALNIIFPAAKVDNNVSLGLSNDLSHPISISAVPDYCSVSKKLFRVEMRVA